MHSENEKLRKECADLHRQLEHAKREIDKLHLEICDHRQIIIRLEGRLSSHGPIMVNPPTYGTASPQATTDDFQPAVMLA